MKESEDEKTDFISQNKIIFKKFKPIKRIGKGTFSSVYIALSLEKNNYVAIKVEKRNKSGIELLETEAFFLYSLRGFGIPEVISFGRTKTHNILVMPLLGQSILDLIIMLGKKLQMNDICLIAIQILERIEWVHSKNIVYRDIKPENFLFGKKDPEVLYLIDFGLCKKYKSSKTGKHILPKNLGKFTGTSRYASVYSMAGNEQSRRDDIESIGYMIIFLMKKKLPWQGIRGNSYKECYHKLYIMKKNIEPEELCKGLPKEMIDYMNNAKSLKFEEEPNYSYLKNLFKTILERNNFNFDKKIFSWIDKPNNFSERNNSFSKLRRKCSSHKRLFEKISKSIEKKNKLILKHSDKTETDFSSSNTNNNNNYFHFK
jgi:serine/threonine protein kinase